MTLDSPDPFTAARARRRRILVGLAVVLPLAAGAYLTTDGGRAAPHLDPLVARELAGRGDCPKPSLPPGVVLRVESAGGVAGVQTRVEVREDGDAFVSSGPWPEAKPRRVEMGRAWVERLDHDLAATGAASSPSACYRRRITRYDALGGAMTWRHAGQVHAWSGGTDELPGSVEEAQTLALHRTSELRPESAVVAPSLAP